MAAVTGRAAHRGAGRFLQEFLGVTLEQRVEHVAVAQYRGSRLESAQARHDLVEDTPQLPHVHQGIGTGTGTGT